MTGDCCVFKFIRRSVDGKHLMRFQSENGAVFKFLRYRVDGGLKEIEPRLSLILRVIMQWTVSGIYTVTKNDKFFLFFFFAADNSREGGVKDVAFSQNRMKVYVLLLM